jgi:adenylate cyclase
VDAKMRVVEVESTSLSQGVYGKYFREGFLDELDKMDSKNRNDTFNHLLSVFKKLESLINVNSSLSFDGNLEESLEAVIADAKSMLSAETVTLFKIHNDTKEMSNFFDDSERFPPGHGLIGYSVESEKMLNVFDPKSCEEYEPDIDSCDLESNPSSMLILPIQNEDAVTAVLVAYNKQNKLPTDNGFNEEDEFICRRLGYTFGDMIKNGIEYESMMNTKKKVTVLLETTRSLASILDLNKLIKVIMDSAKELLSSDRCTLFLHDPDRKQLRAIIQGRDSVQEIRISSSAGIAGAVFTSGSMNTLIQILSIFKTHIKIPDLTQMLISKQGTLPKQFFVCQSRISTANV